jgi:cytochrome c oxidase subunit 4
MTSTPTPAAPGAPHAGSAPGHAAQGPHFNAWAVLVALVVLTGISYLSEVVAIAPPLGTFLIYGVAVCKALCVLAFFMHLKYESGWKWVLVVPPIVMAILLVLALVPDIVHHTG